MASMNEQPEALRDDSVDGFVDTGSDNLEMVPEPTPAIFKLWKMARSPSASESDETDASSRTDDAASSQELLRSIKKSATASKASSSSSPPSSPSSSSTTPQ
jgi:hypothetical protein